MTNNYKRTIFDMNIHFSGDNTNTMFITSPTANSKQTNGIEYYYIEIRKYKLLIKEIINSNDKLSLTEKNSSDLNKALKNNEIIEHISKKIFKYISKKINHNNILTFEIIEKIVQLFDSDEWNWIENKEIREKIIVMIFKIFNNKFNSKLESVDIVELMVFLIKNYVRNILDANDLKDKDMIKTLINDFFENDNNIDNVVLNIIKKHQNITSVKHFLGIIELKVLENITK